MQALFGQYYGLDWLAMVTSLLFIYYIGGKNRNGFIIGIISNVAWIATNVLASVWAGVLLNVILIGLNLRGYIYWGKPSNLKRIQ